MDRPSINSVGTLTNIEACLAHGRPITKEPEIVLVFYNPGELQCGLWPESQLKIV